MSQSLPFYFQSYRPAFSKLAALAAGLALFTQAGADAQVATTANISEVQTSITTGTPQTISGITYSNNRAEITSFTTSNGVEYAPIAYSGTVTTRLVRNPNAATGTNDVTYHMNNTSATSLHGSFAMQEALFNSNNLYQGTDNLFSNTGNSSGNNNNIERVDVIFSEGLTVTQALAFLVLERGGSSHDGFQIAAITAMDGANVDGFGNLLSFDNGTYGTPNVFPASNASWQVTRNPVPGDGEGPTHSSSAITNQRLGGTTIAATDLADLGDLIYGYSIFAIDVDPNRLASDSVFTTPGTVDYGTAGSRAAANLLDVDSLAYLRGTTETAGGIDLVAYTGVAVNAITLIPEPTSFVSVGLGALLLGAFQRRRRKL